jgi:hypothetical protein
LDPCCFPVFQKQSVFLVGGIVSNRATIANFKPTLSREIVDPPGRITLLDNHSPPHQRVTGYTLPSRTTDLWGRVKLGQARIKLWRTRVKLENELALVHTHADESRISDAEIRANKAVAEVQLRQGQPWLASQALDSAAVADHCYPRAHFIRSRIFRIDSMYAPERAELQAAYQIDPSDPGSQRG